MTELLAPEEEQILHDFLCRVDPSYISESLAAASNPVLLTSNPAYISLQGQALLANNRLGEVNIPVEADSHHQEESGSASGDNEHIVEDDHSV